MLLIFLLLFFSIGFSETICSFTGSDVENELELSNWLVSSDSVSLNNSVVFSFNIRNVGKQEKQLTNNGLFVKSIVPGEEQKLLVNDFANQKISPGETFSFNKQVVLNKVGRWSVWPSFEYNAVGGLVSAPDYWHSCSFFVCPENSSCMLEEKAKELFSNPVKTLDDVCGYGEKEEPKYCFKENNTDLDGDGILENDLCPNERETFNSFMDDDGCPDDVPKNCSENQLCLTRAEAKNKVFEPVKPFIVCGYVDAFTPKYCSEPKKFPDLIISTAFVKDNKLFFSIKNAGEKTSFDFKIIVEFGEKIIFTQPVKILEPNVEKNFELFFENCEKKSFFKIIVDSDNSVREKNENNNVEKVFCNSQKEENATDFSKIRVKVNKKNSDCGLRALIELGNTSNNAFENIPLTIALNNQTVLDTIIPSVNGGEDLTIDSNICLKKDDVVNDFRVIIENNSFDFTSNVNDWLVEWVSNKPNCVFPCECIPGNSKESLNQIGFFNCFENTLSCESNQSSNVFGFSSALTTNSFSNNAFCMFLKHKYVNWPCPPLNDSFGFGSNHSFNVVFSGWDEASAGNVLVDGRHLDELVVARDDSHGVLSIYNGFGQKLFESNVRFTKKDRLVVGDVLGDERDEIIIAVDEDAPGELGKFYVYDLNYSGTGFSLDLVKTFEAVFTPYDAVLTGDVFGLGKEQVIVVVDEYDAVFFNEVNDNNFVSLRFKLPVNVKEFTYSNKGNDNTHDEFLVGNVLGDSKPELIWLSNHNDLKNKSKLVVLSLNKDRNGFEIVSKISVPFTKYDRAAIGDVLGDEFEEVLIGIDELNNVLIIDPLLGLLKMHPRRWTKYDELVTGFFIRADKKQTIVITDEDNLARIGFDDDLLPEAS